MTAAPLPAVLLETTKPGLTPHARGKVRDLYREGDSVLLIATDRISAFDCVLPNGIPGKGILLTQLSRFWFGGLRAIVPDHLSVSGNAQHPARLQEIEKMFPERCMLVRAAEMIPVECVARGYLAGSGWKEYLATGSVCGVKLPAGMLESGRLPQPIFTPATKAETGHDQNISFAQAEQLLGRPLASQLRDLTLSLYSHAAEHAAERGIVIADTKFEFGFLDGQLVLADEALTPDSSRFWPADRYRPGQRQPSYDKQFVRDYLESLDWDKTPPAPPLPDSVVAGTSERYREVFRLLTGAPL